MLTFTSETVSSYRTISSPRSVSLKQSFSTIDNIDDGNISAVLAGANSGLPFRKCYLPSACEEDFQDGDAKDEKNLASSQEEISSFGYNTFGNGKGRASVPVSRSHHNIDVDDTKPAYHRRHKSTSAFGGDMGVHDFAGSRNYDVNDQPDEVADVYRRQSVQ